MKVSGERGENGYLTRMIWGKFCVSWSRREIPPLHTLAIQTNSSVWIHWYFLPMIFLEFHEIASLERHQIRRNKKLLQLLKLEKDNRENNVCLTYCKHKNDLTFQDMCRNTTYSNYLKSHIDIASKYPLEYAHRRLGDKFPFGKSVAFWGVYTCVSHSGNFANAKSFLWMMDV